MSECLVSHAGLCKFHEVRSADMTMPAFVIAAILSSAVTAATVDLTPPAPPVQRATLSNVSIGPPAFSAGEHVSFDVRKAALVIVDMQTYF